MRRSARLAALAPPPPPPPPPPRARGGGRGGGGGGGGRRRARAPWESPPRDLTTPVPLLDGHRPSAASDDEDEEDEDPAGDAYDVIDGWLDANMVATPGKNRTDESLQGTQQRNQIDLNSLITPEERVNLKSKKTHCRISKVEEEEMQAKQTDEIIQGQLEQILDELLSPEERRTSTPEGSTVARQPPAAHQRPNNEVYCSTECDRPQPLQDGGGNSHLGSACGPQPTAPERPLLLLGNGGPLDAQPAHSPHPPPALSPQQPPRPPAYTPSHVHIPEYTPVLPSHQSPMHMPEYPPALPSHHTQIHTSEYAPLVAPHLSPMHTPEYSPLLAAHQPPAYSHMPAPHQSPIYTPEYSSLLAAHQPGIHTPQYSPLFPVHQSSMSTPDYSSLPAAHQSPIHTPEYSPLLAAHQSPMHTPEYSPLLPGLHSPIHTPEYSPLPAAHQSPIHTPEYSPLIAPHQSPIHLPEYPPLLGALQSPMNSGEYSSFLPPEQPPEPRASYPPLPPPYARPPLPMPPQEAQLAHTRSSLPPGEATSCSNPAQADPSLFQRPNPWLTTDQDTSGTALNTAAMEEPSRKAEETPWEDILKKLRHDRPMAAPRPSAPATPHGNPRAPPESGTQQEPKRDAAQLDHQPTGQAPFKERAAKEFALSHDQAARRRQVQVKRPPLLQTPSLPPGGHAHPLYPHDMLRVWGRRGAPPPEEGPAPHPQRMRARRHAAQLPYREAAHSTPFECADHSVLGLYPPGMNHFHAHAPRAGVAHFPQGHPPPVYVGGGFCHEAAGAPQRGYAPPPPLPPDYNPLVPPPPLAPHWAARARRGKGRGRGRGRGRARYRREAAHDSHTTSHAPPRPTTDARPYASSQTSEAQAVGASHPQPLYTSTTPPQDRSNLHDASSSSTPEDSSTATRRYAELSSGGSAVGQRRDGGGGARAEFPLSCGLRLLADAAANRRSQSPVPPPAGFYLERPPPLATPCSAPFTHSHDVQPHHKQATIQANDALVEDACLQEPRDSTASSGSPQRVSLPREVAVSKTSNHLLQGNTPVQLLKSFTGIFGKASLLTVPESNSLSEMTKFSLINGHPCLQIDRSNAKILDNNSHAIRTERDTSHQVHDFRSSKIQGGKTCDIILFPDSLAKGPSSSEKTVTKDPTISHAFSQGTSERHSSEVDKTTQGETENIVNTVNILQNETNTLVDTSPASTVAEIVLPGRPPVQQKVASQTDNLDTTRTSYQTSFIESDENEISTVEDRPQEENDTIAKIVETIQEDQKYQSMVSELDQPPATSTARRLSSEPKEEEDCQHDCTPAHTLPCSLSLDSENASLNSQYEKSTTEESQPQQKQFCKPSRELTESDLTESDIKSNEMKLLFKRNLSFAESHSDAIPPGTPIYTAKNEGVCPVQEEKMDKMEGAKPRVSISSSNVVIPSIQSLLTEECSKSEAPLMSDFEIEAMDVTSRYDVFSDFNQIHSSHEANSSPKYQIENSETQILPQQVHNQIEKETFSLKSESQSALNEIPNNAFSPYAYVDSSESLNQSINIESKDHSLDSEKTVQSSQNQTSRTIISPSNEDVSSNAQTSNSEMPKETLCNSSHSKPSSEQVGTRATRKLLKKRDISSPKITLLNMPVSKDNSSDVKLTDVRGSSILETNNSNTSSSPKTANARKRKYDSSSRRRKHKRWSKLDTEVSAFDSTHGALDGIPLPSTGESVLSADVQQSPDSTRCVPEASPPSDCLQTYPLTQHDEGIDENELTQNALSSDSSTQLSLSCVPASYPPDLEPFTNTAIPLEEDRIVSNKTNNDNKNNICSLVPKRKRKPRSQNHKSLIGTESKKSLVDITTVQRIPSKNTDVQYSSSNPDVLHRAAYDISNAPLLQIINPDRQKGSQLLYSANVMCKESPRKRQKTNSRKTTSNDIGASDIEPSDVAVLPDFTMQQTKMIGEINSNLDSSNINYGKKHKRKRKYNRDVSILEDEAMKSDLATPTANDEHVSPSRSALSGRDPKSKDVLSGAQHGSSQMFQLEAEPSLVEESKEEGDYSCLKSEVNVSEEEKTLSPEKRRLLLRIVTDKSENYRSVCEGSLRKKSKSKIRCKKEKLEETTSTNIDSLDRASSLFSQTNTTSFDATPIAYENPISTSRQSIEDPKMSKISDPFPPEDNDLLNHPHEEEKQWNAFDKVLPEKSSILRSIICRDSNSNKDGAVNYFSYSEHSYCMRAARNDTSTSSQTRNLEPLELEEIRGSNDQVQSCVILSPVQENVLASDSEVNWRLATTTSPSDIFNEDVDLQRTENPIFTNVEPNVEPSNVPSSPIEALDNARNEIKITSSSHKKLCKTQPTDGIKDFSVTDTRKKIKFATSDNEISTACKVTISKNKLSEGSSSKIHQTELQTLNMSPIKNEKCQNAENLQLQRMVQSSTLSAENDANLIQNTDNIIEKSMGNLQRERKSAKISTAKYTDTSVSIEVEKVDPNCTKLSNEKYSSRRQHEQIILNSRSDILLIQNSSHEPQKKNTDLQNLKTKLKYAKKCTSQKAISLAKKNNVAPSNILVPREKRGEGIERRISNSLTEGICATSSGQKLLNQSSTTKLGRSNIKHTTSMINEECVEVSKTTPTNTEDSPRSASENIEYCNNAHMENPKNISEDSQNISSECTEMSAVNANDDRLESFIVTREEVTGAEEKIKEHRKSLKATKGEISKLTKDLDHSIHTTKDISDGKYNELEQGNQILTHESCSQNNTQNVALTETETSTDTYSGAMSQLTKKKLSLKIKNLSNNTNRNSKPSGNPNIFEEREIDEREFSKKMVSSRMVDKIDNKPSSISTQKILPEGQPSIISPSACSDDLTSPESSQGVPVAGNSWSSPDRLTKRLRKHRKPRRVSPEIEVVYERTHQENEGELTSPFHEFLANTEREKKKSKSVPCESKHRRNAGYASTSNVCNELLSSTLSTNDQIEQHCVSLTPVSRPSASAVSCVTSSAAFDPLDLSCRPKPEQTITASPSSSLSLLPTSARAVDSPAIRPALNKTSLSSRSFVYDGNSPENLCIKDILSGATSSDPFSSVLRQTCSNSSTSENGKSSETPPTPHSDDTKHEKMKPEHQTRPSSPEVIIVLGSPQTVPSSGQPAPSPGTETPLPSATSESASPATPSELQSTTNDVTHGGRNFLDILPGPSTSHTSENMTSDLQVLLSNVSFGKKWGLPTAFNDKVENRNTSPHVAWRPTAFQSYTNSRIGKNGTKRLDLSDLSKSSMSFVDAAMIEGTSQTETLCQVSCSPQNKKPSKGNVDTTTPSGTLSEEGNEDEHKTTAHFEENPLRLQSGFVSQPLIQSLPESFELRAPLMHDTSLESSDKSMGSSHRQQLPSREENPVYTASEEGSILRDAIDLLRMNESMCAQASAQGAQQDPQGFVYRLLDASPEASAEPAPSPEPPAGRSVTDILDFLARDDPDPSPSPQTPLPSFQCAFSRPPRPQP